MTALPQRQELVAQVRAAQASGARLERACAEVGISVRTWQRWDAGEDVLADARPDAVRPVPANRLSEPERRAVLEVCMQPRFADMPPTHIVPILAAGNRNLASESTFYRLLHAHSAQHHRGRQRCRNRKPPAQHVARRPNEIWCWDVTWLPSPVRGLFFYLYAVIDLFSRKIVAWEVHAAENGDLAAQLIERARWREHIAGKPLILHADNGAAQRSFTLYAELQELGITPSHSRPSVSDDNAFIESWFRTLKYMPAYPSAGFASMDQARNWAMHFIDWYSAEDRHRELGFVTPNQRHGRQSAAILARRREVYRAAQRAHPERWCGDIRRWAKLDHVHLNRRDKGRRAA